MARIDLNIIDRGTPGSVWTAEGVSLKPEDLDKVIEQKTDNVGALNSLPTPFARFFVAKEAFRRVHEEHISKNVKEAGFAYRQLVSDILDVYELLFYKKFHENIWAGPGNSTKIEIREWDSEANLRVISQKMKVLYNSIREYYKSDINEKSLFFVVLTEEGKEKLLACTSPYTGFVTPPDLDKYIRDTERKKDDIVFANSKYDNVLIPRKSGGLYFRDTKLFEDRTSEFRNYMMSLFGKGDISGMYKEIKSYIRAFKDDADIRTDFEQKMDSVLTEQNDPLVVNGMEIKMCDEIDVNNYFCNNLIKLPYRIDRKRFTTIKIKNDSKDRMFDFLIPFKPEICELFPDMDIDAEAHINRNSVTVTLRYQGREYKREYWYGKNNDYEVEELETKKWNFDIGLFPNILSAKPEENNYFKVMVVSADGKDDDLTLDINKVGLKFYKNSREIYESESGEYGVRKPRIRSEQHKKDAECGTRFYELFGTSFDYMQVDVDGITGLLFPRWENSEACEDVYKYAIDLGTSNTLVARCKAGEEMSPEIFCMEAPMVSYLHEPEGNEQMSAVKRIEDSIFDLAKKKIKTEFVPALIDGKDYRFPIRTAICGSAKNPSRPSLFDTHNIAFFYEKMMMNDDQDIQTDVKWEKNEAMLRLFLRELLLIIKADVLQRGGNLSRTDITWFRPLSFMGEMREIYQDVWQKETKEVLNLKTEVHCYSESEAPYYYFKRMDYILDSDAAAVIDIGGGSTDIVYFIDNKPEMANSVHFGCDVLWDEGFVGNLNDRRNGIFQKYADHLDFGDKILNELNTCFVKVDKKTKTKDIISFWLSHAKECGITTRMRSDFKPVFVYHLTSILYYMGQMYKDYGKPAPKSVLFSGNGSKYIDGFISTEIPVIKKIVDMVFSKVFGDKQNVSVKLPEERKEATCFGGLYRDVEAENVPEIYYQGDTSFSYETVGDINNHFDKLSQVLATKYVELADLYQEILIELKRQQILDNTCDTQKYVDKAKDNMDTYLKTYFKSQIKDKYSQETMAFESVFFLPVQKAVNEMTKI